MRYSWTNSWLGLVSGLAILCALAFAILGHYGDALIALVFGVLGLLWVLSTRQHQRDDARHLADVRAQRRAIWERQLDGRDSDESDSSGEPPAS